MVRWIKLLVLQTGDGFRWDRGDMSGEQEGKKTGPQLRLSKIERMHAMELMRAKIDLLAKAMAFDDEELQGDNVFWQQMADITLDAGKLASRVIGYRAEPEPDESETAGASGGVLAINAERERQLRQGYDADGDDGYKHGELRLVAAAVISNAASPMWPQTWDVGLLDRYRAKGYRKCLMIAGALLAAEIDRIDRVGDVDGLDCEEDAADEPAIAPSDAAAAICDAKLSLAELIGDMKGRGLWQKRVQAVCDRLTDAERALPKLVAIREMDFQGRVSLDFLSEALEVLQNNCPNADTAILPDLARVLEQAQRSHNANSVPRKDSGKYDCNS